MSKEKYGVALLTWDPKATPAWPRQLTGFVVLAKTRSRRQAERLADEHGETIRLLGLEGESVEVVPAIDRLSGSH